MLVAVHVIVLFPGTPFLETKTKLILVPFVGVLVGLLILSAWFVERGHNVYSRSVTNFTVSASTMLSVIFCGGFVESHATPFLVAPLVVCFCISPRNEAIAVGTFTFITPLLMDIATRTFGIELPDYTSTASTVANSIFLMGTLFLTIVMALTYLQKTNEELHDALDHDRKLFENWASIDPLTEIGNRRFFEMQVEEALKEAEASNSSFSILYMDLNGFKKVNDDYGHEAGDKILKTVAKRLDDAARSGDHVARLGGDEFVVLLSAPVDTSVLISQTARLRAAVENPIQIGAQRHDIFASLGRASYPTDGENLSELIRTADMDMYTQKMRSKLSNSQRSVGSKTAV
ncbi:MAG: GGDEF domain-containing protein [Rhizobiaceae bacterium]|nr:GGDEF domain-containing protein [Rhizobiaceae bacterium]